LGPAPIPFRHSAGAPGLHRISDKIKSENYPDFLIVNTLCADGHTIARDFYQPSSKGHIAERRCHVCSMDFQAKAAKERHRPKLHPRDVGETKIPDPALNALSGVKEVLRRNGESSDRVCVRARRWNVGMAHSLLAAS